MMTGASGERGWDGLHVARSMQNGAQRCPGAKPAHAITLSEVFARLAEALEADAGALSIEGHVMRYARPSRRRLDH